MQLTDATTYRDQAASRRLLLAPEEQGATWCPSLYWTAPGPLRLPGPGDVNTTVEPRKVRVHKGRWVIDCPCWGAQYACRTDHRHFCPDCCNRDAGGGWVPVIWPAPFEVELIEALLLARPDPATRNWIPGESAADLQAENVEHGIGA